MGKAAKPLSPVIGISGCKTATKSIQAMIDQVERCGATARFLDSHDMSSATKALAGIDALILMGNDFDIDPSHYIHRYPEGDPRRCIHPETNSELATPEGKARAEYEDALLRGALDKKMPVFGICGGMQRINVVCGGTLHQHVPDLAKCHTHDQKSRGIEPHIPVVPVLVIPQTLLGTIAHDIRMKFISCHAPSMGVVIHENSIHHQAIDIIAPGLCACSVADAFPRTDGTKGFMVKAIEADPNGPYAKQFILGVQWHPEFGASALGTKIIQRLVKEAAVFAAKH